MSSSVFKPHLRVKTVAPIGGRTAEDGKDLMAGAI
ncbi:hypothetical protein THIOKS11380038 [Thiocapsa sp. KS1]|nr:hypothetical protein THIOKS11380038 [Thiocapsa sp. KS1]